MGADWSQLGLPGVTFYFFKAGNRINVLGTSNFPLYLALNKALSI